MPGSYLTLEKNNMKKLIFSVIAIVGYIGICVCSIWAIVSFIIYLVKDIPFNWWSVWTFLICCFVTFCGFVLSAIYGAKEARKETDGVVNKWQQRIKEMQARNK